MQNSEREMKLFFHTYKRLPFEIKRGDGVYLFSNSGRKYLDMFAGLAVNALGYGNKKILNAIKNQSEKYIHLSNYFLQKPQIELAEILIKQTGFDKIFFTNSGTEATEGAIKIVRKWGKKKNKFKIISFTNSFHGRTYGALSLMDRNNYKEGFEPFLDNFIITEFNDINSLRKNVNDSIAAVFLEFIQGEGGIQVASEKFVDELFNLKDRHNFLVVSDEIQSGLGRTGKFFAFEHYDIKPEIITIAKPLGGGLPLGAILGTSTVSDTLEPGSHGTTFGGNPVACAAGIAFLNELVQNKIIKNAEQVGKYFISKLKKLQSQFPSLVKDVRGKGLMLGTEMNIECNSIVAEMRERGILINCTNGNVLRFLPPLVITKKHVDKTVENLEETFKKIISNSI